MTARGDRGGALPPPETFALPTAPGVYRFLDASGAVLYLGRATDLRRRTRSYWPAPGGRPHLAEMMPAIAAVHAVRCRSVHEASWLERSLLTRELHPWNLTRGGEERPLYLEVTGPPRVAVALTGIRRTGTTTFGPLLGGRKSRMLVSALERSLPALSTLAPLPGDPTPEITRLMSGDAVAITAFLAGLVARRESAARALAFELAARITAEIEAVEWLLAPQRVVGNAAADLWIGARTGGVDVRFGLRDGAIVEWIQRADERASDGPEVHEGTPAEWRDFVLENAALAAAMRQMSARPRG